MPYGQRRESADLAEEALASLQAVQAQPADPAGPDEGTDDGRKVTVYLGATGLTGCEINPRWAARSSHSALDAALSSALHRALANRAAVPRPSEGIDALVGDALATLASFTAPPQAQGGNR